MSSGNYRAMPISRNNIRRYVLNLKKMIGWENQLYFPILYFTENVLPLLIPDFQFEVLPKSDMGNKHGQTFPSQKLIFIREDIYIGAIEENGRDRLTVAHEVGHLLLHDEKGIYLCRTESPKQKTYEDPEWQASAFGGELLASSWLIRGMTIEEVSRQCRVSTSAAKVQLQSLSR